MKKQNNKNKPNDEKSLDSTPCSASVLTPEQKVFQDHYRKNFLGKSLEERVKMLEENFEEESRITLAAMNSDQVS